MKSIGVLALLANTVPARDRPAEVLATLARATQSARAFRSERLKAGPHRGLACRSAGHRRQQVEPGGGRSKQPCVIRVDHRLDGGNLAMPAEQRKARPDHRLPANRAILLGLISAGAQAAPGCDDHRCHHPGHVGSGSKSETRPWH